MTKISQQVMIMRKNSLTHIVLLFSKFYGKPITIKDLEILNPMFKKKDKIARQLKRLSDAGLITIIDKDTWEITPKGRGYLYAFGHEHPGTNARD